MNIAGIFKASTSFGKTIRSGGAALVVNSGTDDERVFAIAEERASRFKYAGGYQDALALLLESANLSEREIDMCGVSSCCESRSSVEVGVNWPSETLEIIGHHDSHATLAYLGSGFKRALVVVMDGGGDVLVDAQSDNWWTFPREQHSYYIATEDGLELIGRDFDQPFEAGFGEIYRAVTYFLGWHGSRHASKIMALSAYGSSHADWPQLFDLNDDRLVVPVRNNPKDPLSMVYAMANHLGTDVGEPREPGGELLQVHKDSLLTFNGSLSALL